MPPQLSASEHSCATMRASLLRSTVEGFCQKFVSGASPDSILDADFSTSAPCITEHGPRWAAGHLPYLAHTFHGRRPIELILSWLSLRQPSTENSSWCTSSCMLARRIRAKKLSWVSPAERVVLASGNGAPQSNDDNKHIFPAPSKFILSKIYRFQNTHSLSSRSVVFQGVDVSW